MIAGSWARAVPRRLAAAAAGAVVVGGLVVGLVVGTSVTATAAAGTAADAPADAHVDLLLSTDGRTWSPQLPGLLFAGVAAAVPGDRLTGTLWVRNASHDEARVELVVADGVGDGSDTLAGALALSLDGEPLTGGERWHGPDLAPGTSRRLDVVATLTPGAGSAVRLQVAHVLDAVLLVQTQPGSSPAASPSASAPASPPPAPVDPPHDGLAQTGADVSAALWSTLAAVGVGWLLLTWRRRRT